MTHICDDLPFFDFFIYGTQYHRAPVPLPDEWDDDFKKMRELGYNTIKFWLIWKWVERSPGKYCWDTYDALLECAQQHNLKVVPNTILEMAPEWLYQKYPESVLFVDSTGRPAQDLVGQAYQLGGYMPDWNCEEARTASYDFLAKAMKRYQNHPAILSINIWNEPCWLPSYGNATVQAFRRWLRDKFQSIDEFNDSTGQAIVSFDDVRPPVSAAHFPLGLQYRLFMMDRLCIFMSERTAVVKKYFPGVPVSSHSIMPLSHNNDEWRQSATVDFWGTSSHQTYNKFDHDFSRIHWPDYPMIYDVISSACAYSWCTEMRSGQQCMGSSGEHYTPQDIRHWMYTVLGHGMKGLLLWQYKPERIGPEAPECGIVTLDGQDTERCVEVKKFSDFVHQHESFLINSRPFSSGVGILVGEKQMVMGQLAAESGETENLYIESLKGIYRALWTYSVHPEFYNIEAIAGNVEINNLPKVLIVPFFPYLDQQQAGFLRDYVKCGGTLIAEGGLGSYDYRGWYSKVLPSCGLEEVFGLTEGERRTIDTVSFSLNDGINTAGSHYLRKINLTTATVKGTFGDGTPAVTEHSYGSGKAIYIATHASINCSRYEETPALNFWYELIKDNIVLPVFKIEKMPGITYRCLCDNSNFMILLYNRLETVTQVEISHPENYRPETVYGEILQNAAGCLKLNIPARDVGIIRLDRKL